MCVPGKFDIVVEGLGGFIKTGIESRKTDSEYEKLKFHCIFFWFVITIWNSGCIYWSDKA